MKIEERIILERFGWNEWFEEKLKAKGLSYSEIGRVVWENRGFYKIESILGVFNGKLRGKLINRGEIPVTGDWVIFKREENTEFLIIEGILERKSKISRKSAGDITEEQILAANTDIVFVVTALDEDFNLRRIERYLALVWESGAKPVILLTKKDIAENVEEKVREVEKISFDTQVIAVSSFKNENIESVKKLILYGKTAVLIGSSGTGKSTLINSIIGEELLKTGEIREKDGRGKHTTTSREMIFLDNGGIVIDSPGLREIQLWDVKEGISSVFEDVEKYMGKCKFRNCTHTVEPGCAIIEAIENGEISEKRYQNYLKLKKEERYIAGKTDEKIREEEKNKWKEISKFQKVIYKKGGKK